MIDEAWYKSLNLKEKYLLFVFNETALYGLLNAFTEHRAMIVP